MKDTIQMTIHQTAIIENDVSIGRGTSIWDNVHIRHDTAIGDDCVVGEKTYIAYDVRIGHKVKINAFVYICTQVIIEDWVMISAGTVFTNDKFPRAVDPSTEELITSNPTDETLTTIVRQGVTIGANATIGPGIEIGEFSMVGMGSVVTRNVLPYTLVIGNPARVKGYVCRCGASIGDHGQNMGLGAELICSTCSRTYKYSGQNDIIPS